MNKENVYEAIDSELAYISEQEQVDDSHVVEDFPLAAGLEAIRYNVDKASQFWYIEQAPYPNAMHFLRKVAAICVKMGIKYDMPKRDQ